MKVKELIETLSQLDPELMVVIKGYEGGVNEMTHYDLCNIWLNANDEWYYGAHEVQKYSHEYTDNKIVKAIVL
jgi:hypothetical protein